MEGRKIRIFKYKFEEEKDTYLSIDTLIHIMFEVVLNKQTSYILFLAVSLATIMADLKDRK